MKSSIKKGFGFGVTSGIITTLGMMIGLERGTHNVSVIVAGIAVIAVTDSLSDAFAIFMADETERESDQAKWQEALATFFSKFLVGASFALPFFFLEITQAIIFSVSFGLLLILILTYFIAKNEKRPALKLMLGHILATILVIIISGMVGQWADSLKENPKF
jgi:VIT1/CCC1 family predicted Fe2+/Mn2+ transporter